MTERRAAMRAKADDNTFRLAETNPEVVDIVTASPHWPDWGKCKDDCTSKLCCVYAKYGSPSKFPVDPDERIKLPTHVPSKANRALLAELEALDEPTEEDLDAAEKLTDKLAAQKDCVSYMRFSIRHTGTDWYSYNLRKDYFASTDPAVTEHRKGRNKRQALRDRIAARKRARTD